MVVEAKHVRREVVRAVRAGLSTGKAEGRGGMFVTWLILWLCQAWYCVWWRHLKHRTCNEGMAGR